MVNNRLDKFSNLEKPKIYDISLSIRFKTPLNNLKDFSPEKG